MKTRYGIMRNLTKQFNRLLTIEQERRDNLNDKKEKKFKKGL